MGVDAPAKGAGMMHRVGTVEPRWVSPEYLAFVRTHACIICDEPPPSKIYHAHPDGWADSPRLITDAYAVPVCHGCMRRWWVGRAEQSRDYAIWVSRAREAQVILLAGWYRLRE